MPDGGDLRSRAIINLAREDYYFFSRYLFRVRKGFRWQRAPHHQLICDALMRVFRGECKRLIINIPPRGSKTELVVINFIAWALGHYPDSEFIHTSYSARLATNNVWQCRELVQSKAYREIFSQVALRDDSKAKDEWRTTAGGVVYAAGAGGTITGYGAGKARQGFGGAILIDDPLKADEARSKVMRDNAIEFFRNTLESRKNSPDTPIILIMQRLHQGDPAGWLLDGGNGEEWEHVCVPALDAERQSIWPEKWTTEDLLRMEAASPYMFAGQFMQRPSPAEGGVFKPDAMPVVDALPVGVRVDWVRGWDFGATETGDPSAGARLGRLSDGRYIIADVVRARLGPEERDQALKNTSARDGLDTVVGLPQDPGQAGLSQVKYFCRLLAGHRVRTSPESGDKVVRAEPFASQVNVGNVLMLRAPWNDALVAEMRLFPNGTHDDQIDALSRAFGELIGNAPAQMIWPEAPEPLTGHPGELVRFAGERIAGTCGACAAFREGQCMERGFMVQPKDPACPMFSAS